MNLKNEAIAKQLETMLTNAMVSKFKSQGHNLTGKGIASLKTEVKSNAGGLLIQILGEDYMGFQDSGRKAGKMPPIAALERWVQLRGIASDMKEVSRIAWGIAINMKRIGMHSTRKRLDMSKRHFISSTIQKESPTINNMLFQMFSTNFDLLVTNMTNKMSKTIINLN